MNIWRKQLLNHKNCFWISYEDLKYDTTFYLGELINFISEQEHNKNLVKKVVEFADFKNMQKMEAGGVFKTQILEPTDLNDQNSFKVRKGKVGGYKEELSNEDLNYVENAISSLDVFFQNKYF